MAGDMRRDFEEYIRELTESISKEIFLEDLKGICDKYSRQLQQYEQLILVAENAADRMGAFSESEEADIRALSVKVNEELEGIHAAMEGLNQEYVRIFEEFSARVALLNQGERDAFVQTLDGKISEYEEVLVRGLEREYRQLFKGLTEEFEAVCRKNDVQYKDFEQLVEDARTAYNALVSGQETALAQMAKVDRTVEERLKEIEERIAVINERHVEVFEQFSEKVTKLNAGERESFGGELRKLLEEYRGSFAEEIASKYDVITEKFRGDLGDIYGEYEGQLKEYRGILQEVQNHNRLIQGFTAKNVPALEGLQRKVEEQLTRMNHTLAGITKEYEEVFSGFSGRVTALNEEERSKFLLEMRQSFMGDMLAMQRGYEQSVQQWQEQAQQLVNGMNEAASEQRLQFQQERKAFVQYIGQQLHEFKNIMEEEHSVQRQLGEQLAAQRKELQSYWGELQNVKDRMTRDQEDFHLLIRKNEKQAALLLDSLAEAQEKMEEKQNAMWENMVKEWNQLQHSIEKQNRTTPWKIFMALTNTLLVVLLIILILLQMP